MAEAPRSRGERRESDVVLGDTVVTAVAAPENAESAESAGNAGNAGNAESAESAESAGGALGAASAEEEPSAPAANSEGPSPPPASLPVSPATPTKTKAMPTQVSSSLRSQQNVIIAISAHRRGRGSSLGTCSKGSELEGQIGLPLNVFKFEQNISMPRAIVMANPYLASKLTAPGGAPSPDARNERPPASPTTPNSRISANTPAPTKTKSSRFSVSASPGTAETTTLDDVSVKESADSKHHSIRTPTRQSKRERGQRPRGLHQSLRIRVTSPAMVKAFVLVCQELMSGNLTRTIVDQSDQLHLYSAASEVGVPRLQALCESVISQRLTPRRFVASVRIALRHGRDPMLRLCYYWFKIKGATDFDVVQRRASMTATERAVDSVVSADALPRSSLYLHATGDQGIEVSAGGAHRFPLEAFASVLQDEHRRKAFLFRPPEEEPEEETEERSEKHEGGQQQGNSMEGDTSSSEKGEKLTRGKEDREDRDAVDDSAKKNHLMDAEGEGQGQTAEERKAGEAAASSEDAVANTNGRMFSIVLEKANRLIEKALAAKGFKGLKKCHVVRERHQGPNADQTRYSVFSEKDGSFIVAAMSTTGKTFTFSLDPDDFRRESPSYVGRMDCSFTGTTFTLYDYGVERDLLSPNACGSLEAGGVGVVEHAVVIYDTNVLGRIPNAMTVHIPHVAGNVAYSEDAPYHKAEAAAQGELAAVTASSNDFTRLKTRKPIWSDDLEAWTMDFHGRVKLASKKNFLLVSENAPTDVLMLFGKVAKSHFSLDYKAPLTVMQAFCVALTSFADKLMVT